MMRYRTARHFRFLVGAECFARLLPERASALIIPHTCPRTERVVGYSVAYWKED